MEGRRRAAAALVFVARVLVVFLVIEGAASLLFVGVLLLNESPPALAERSHTRYDAQLGWVNRESLALADFYGPGASLHLNERGFRDERPFGLVGEALAPGRVGVVCSGDSFTLGYGVGDRETWCRQLESLDPRIHTVNMGQGGYGVDQAYLWYLRDGAALPHLVHVFAFITEDFARMRSTQFFGYGKPRLRLADGELRVENVPVPRADYALPWLTRNLPLLDQLRSVHALRGIFFGRRTPPAPLAEEEATALALAVFEDLARRHRAAGRQLVLVHLPMEDELDGRHTERWRRMLARECAERGLVFVDLVPAFRALSPRDAARAFSREGSIDFAAAAGHYTDFGNRLVAEALYPRLASLPGFAERP